MDLDWSVLGFSGVREMMNIHPIIVHIPVALFPASLLFYGLGIVLKRPSLCVAGRACLYLAVLGAAAAVWTGEAAEESLPHNARIHRLLEAHEQIGWWIARLGVAAAGWSFFQRDHRPRLAPAFLALLGVVTLMVAQNGDLGGRMVYVEGAGVKAALPAVTSQPQPNDEEEPHHHDEQPHEHTHH